MPEISQVILNGSTLMSVTSDTVTPEHVENGYTFHAANGALCTGNMNPGGTIYYNEAPAPQGGGITVTIGMIGPSI